MHLYHGTLGPKKYQFVPFSHFGTRTAAVERIARRILEGGEGDPVVLKLSFHFNEGEILKLSEDWGSNQPISLARALKDHFENVDSDEYEIFEKIRLELTSRKSNVEEFHEYGWERLGSALTAMRISAIQYPNAVEAPDSFSYCVVPRTRRICVNASKPTHDELEEAKKAVRRVMGNVL